MRRGLCVKCGTPTVYRKLNGISHGGDGGGGVYVRTGWLTTASPVDIGSRLVVAVSTAGGKLM